MNFTHPIIASPLFDVYQISQICCTNTMFTHEDTIKRQLITKIRSSHYILNDAPDISFSHNVTLLYHNDKIKQGKYDCIKVTICFSLLLFFKTNEQLTCK